ncbi:MAG: type I restriction endonuclease subunit R [Methanosphaera sp.]|nr:type I restriction endonuclease subunit R [Methanosphaera sp.]
MPTQSESTLENILVEDLSNNGYEKITIKNDEELEQNFRTQLEKFNNITLTDDEFEKILIFLKQGTIFDKAQKLRDSYTLQREGQADKWIRFINKDEWCKNQFQVAHQIQSKNKHNFRYDVTLLINGLPLVQIELKKRGVEIKQAFNQIRERYLPTFKGLFQYIQIFVISNGVDTKYFATGIPNSIKFEYTYFWKTKENRNIKQLAEFSQTFLEKCNLAKMITQFMVLNQIDKNIMILRAYQKYAVEEIIHQATKVKQNGYIWHTTGSGKTLTSFKTSQILSENPNIDKVIFVVDRKDLDTQTMKRFNQYEKDSVAKVYNTYSLIKKLNSTKTKLIITTIQKLSNVATKHQTRVAQIKDKRIIFIYDECHRSQFGKMHQSIIDYFQNSLCFGFTGTPIFVENAKGGSKTTKTIFGKRLHTYMIKDAIRDNNVLGFSIQYYESNPISKEDIDVNSLAYEELLMNDKRLEKNVDKLLETYPSKTQHGKFNAMFTVSRGKFINKYYKILKEKAPELKIAAIYNANANKEDNNGKSDYSYLSDYMEDYNQTFGTNFSPETFKEYNIDISNRMENREIDLLLVKDMYTTGFDCPRLNTLYVDKNLQYHTLLQTFSRTNRIFDKSKAYGNIICFRDISADTDEALTLFSDNEPLEDLLMKDYKTYVKEFNEAYEKFLELTQTVEDAQNLESETEIKEYVENFRELNRIKSKLDTFPEFTFDDLEMDEQEYNDHKSVYLDIHDELKDDTYSESILQDIDFELELIRDDTINVDYILGLLKYLNKDDANYEKDIERIKKLTKETEQLRNKNSLIEKFIEKVLGVFDRTEMTVEEKFYEFMREERKKAFCDLIEKENLDETATRKLIDEYQFSGIMDTTLIENAFIEKPKFKERRVKRSRVKDELLEIFEIYD